MTHPNPKRGKLVDASFSDPQQSSHHIGSDTQVYRIAAWTMQVAELRTDQQREIIYTKLKLVRIL